MKKTQEHETQQVTTEDLLHPRSSEDRTVNMDDLKQMVADAAVTTNERVNKAIREYRQDERDPLGR